jgi:hypothetical protein
VPAAVLGWRITEGDRAALLVRFPPRYGETVADHITHGRQDKAPPLPEATIAEVIGHADDGTGVEALVVAIGGGPDRWDGSRYHITWSLGPGREARESNQVIATRGWQRIEGGPPVGLIPAEWP